MSSRTPAGSRPCRGLRGRRLLVALSLPAVLAIAACGDDEPEGGDAPTAETVPATTLEEGARDEGGGTEPTDGPAGPDPSTLPEAVAPVGLGAVSLPTDAEGVDALFDALPAELLGADREIVDLLPGMVGARYDTGERECSEVGLQAIDLAAENGPYPDDWRADDVVALFASGADWDVEEAGHEAARFWVTFETYCGGEDMERDEIVSSAVWGDEDGSWMFLVGAADAADRELLLGAFVDAAASTQS